jgi:hypothetical protein
MACISIYAKDNWSDMRKIEKMIVAPTFREKTYPITEYGATGDGVSDALPAIKKAIDICSASGGGKVVVPKGKYFSKGPVVLKSNVNLHFEDGAEILFSPDEKDYLPAVLTRWEGTELYNYSPMIYAYNVKNIAITGKGVINGQGSKNMATWKPRQKKDQTLLRKMGTEVRPVYERVFGEGHVLRPAMIEPVSCSNVLIEGIKVVDGTFWTIHPIFCTNITVRGVEVESYNDNNDGCDPESCLNVLIENCVFKTGDDGIAIKSGRDNDAWRVGQPSENIIIRNCVFDSKINSVCIGSEISGGVRNVFIENIKINNCTEALYFKSNLDRGGSVENVHVRNVEANAIRSSLIKFEPNYKNESKNNFPTLFKGFSFKNIKAEKAGVCGIDISGFEGMPVEDVSIENLTLKSTPVPLITQNAKNVILKKVMINGVEVVNAQLEWKNKTEKALNNTILSNAEWAMQQTPVTVTNSFCKRSAGSIHDFYSEGDYWWPDPSNPDGPYIRRDGETNPENFIDHRLAMIRFSKIVGYLASAYIVTGDEKYVKQALKHLNAWFINEKTRMNPNLLYAQAIKGIATGRGTGIIDTVHLMEVAQGLIKMQNAACVDAEELKAIKQWFSDYLQWLTTHPYGVDEMNAKNNHGTCWVMQAASFAKLTGNSGILSLCRKRFKEVLLPSQMKTDGSFPQELARTKPYGYSLFNLDAMVTICQILSESGDDLWTFTTDNGLNIKKSIDFMYPCIKDKSTWQYPPDVMYWNEWPVAQPALIFGAVAYNNQAFFDLWKGLNHNPSNGEVERNLPVRNPLIWMD